MPQFSTDTQLYTAESSGGCSSWMMLWTHTEDFHRYNSSSKVILVGPPKSVWSSFSLSSPLLISWNSNLPVDLRSNIHLLVASFGWWLKIWPKKKWDSSPGVAATSLTLLHNSVSSIARADAGIGWKAPGRERPRVEEQLYSCSSLVLRTAAWWRVHREAGLQLELCHEEPSGIK